MPISFFDIENNHVLSESHSPKRERVELRFELSLKLSSRDNLLALACYSSLLLLLPNVPLLDGT